MDNCEYWTKEQLKSEMQDILNGRIKTHENCKYYLTMNCYYYRNLSMPEIRKNLINIGVKDLKKMKSTSVCRKWRSNKAI